MVITLQEYKDYAKITQTELDSFLEIMAEEAESIVESYLGRKLVADDYTDYYDGTNSNYLIVDNYPINSITSIYKYEDGVYQELDLSEYNYRTFGHKIIIDDYIFEEGVGNYKVVYNGGWESLPKDIELALKKLFVVLFNESPYKNNTLGMASFIKQNERIFLDGKAQDKILASIANHRVYNV